jgi:hypothetical protein
MILASDFSATTERRDQKRRIVQAPSFEVRVLTPNCGSDIIVADIRTLDDAGSRIRSGVHSKFSTIVELGMIETY